MRMGQNSLPGTAGFSPWFYTRATHLGFPYFDPPVLEYHKSAVWQAMGRTTAPLAPRCLVQNERVATDQLKAKRSAQRAIQKVNPRSLALRDPNLVACVSRDTNEEAVRGVRLPLSLIAPNRVPRSCEENTTGKLPFLRVP